MSGTTSSIQNPNQGLVNGDNSTQDLKNSASLHGRAFHKVSESGKYIIQSISQLAQSILSTCIRVVSFGRYNLASLKSYLFTKQTPLEKAAKDNSSATPPSNPISSSAPPPPKMPTQVDLNRASSMRLSNMSNFNTFNNNPHIANSRPITADEYSFENRDLGLEGSSANSKPTIVSSLEKDLVSEQEYDEPSPTIKEKSKDPKAGFMGITKHGITNGLKNLRKTKKNNIDQE